MTTYREKIDLARTGRLAGTGENAYTSQDLGTNLDGDLLQISNKLKDNRFSLLNANGQSQYWKDLYNINTWSVTNGILQLDTKLAASANMTQEILAADLPSNLDAICKFSFYAKVPTGGRVTSLRAAVAVFYSGGYYSCYPEQAQNYDADIMSEVVVNFKLSSNSNTENPITKIRVTIYCDFEGISIYSPRLIFNPEVSESYATKLLTESFNTRITTNESNITKLDYACVDKYNRISNPLFIGVPSNLQGAGGWWDNIANNTYSVVGDSLEVVNIGGVDAQPTVTIQDTVLPDMYNQYIRLSFDIFIPSGYSGESIGVAVLGFYNGGGYWYVLPYLELSYTPGDWNSYKFYFKIEDNKLLSTSLDKIRIDFRLKSAGVKLRKPYLMWGVQSSIEGELVEKVGNITNINAIGDSLTQGDFGGGGSYPTLLGNLCSSDVVVNNLGIGGEDVPTILGRVGKLPYMLGADVELPSDTTPVIIGDGTTSGLISCYNNQQVKPLLQGNSGIEYCYIDGVKCLLTWDSTNYKLARVESGESRMLYADSIITTKSNEVYDYNTDINIFYTGTNLGFSSLDEFVDMIKVAIINCKSSKYLIIGLHSNIGVDTRENVEARFQREFGSRYINLRKYLIGNALSDLSITTTAQDLIDIGNGNVPTSLRWDSVHLNISGRTATAIQIFNRLSELNYI